MKCNQTAGSHWLATATAISLLALTAGTSVATETPKTSPAVAASESAGSANSMRAYIDPATGLLRQPTEEDRAAEARVSAAAVSTLKGSGFTITKLADGSQRALDTEGVLMESVTATRNPDGSIAYVFVAGDGTQEPQAAAPAAKMEEK